MDSPVQILVVHDEYRAGCGTLCSSEQTGHGGGQTRLTLPAGADIATSGPPARQAHESKKRYLDFPGGAA